LKGGLSKIENETIQNLKYVRMKDWKFYVMIGSILIGGFLLSKIVRWLISKSLLIENSKIKTDITRAKFLKNAASLIIWLVVFGLIIFQIPEFQTLGVSLFAGAGILLAAIGFAAQEAFSNIVSGVFIVIFRPFRVGDMIKVGAENYGIVEDITLRHTVILNFENKRMIIPNSIISSDVIVNDSIEDQKVCRYIEVGISFDSDIELAIRILQEEGLKHPLSIDGRTKKEKKENVDVVEVRFLKFNEYSMDLRAYVWTDDPLNALKMHSEINLRIKKRFDEEGIEIPFPYRTVVYKNDMKDEKK
jgi:small conductance mechanosensitive channel